VLLIGQNATCLKHIINKDIIVIALRRSCLSSGLSIATQSFVFVDDNASLLLLLICLFLFQDSGVPRRSSTALVEIKILDFGVIETTRQTGPSKCYYYNIFIYNML
jgi:hypothetical protein